MPHFPCDPAPLRHAGVWYSHLFAATLLVIVAALSGAAAEETPAKPASTLHVTDFGITDKWSEDLPMVASFDPKGKFHSVFDADAPGLGHVLLAMPSDNELADIPAPRLQQLMAARLHD